MKKAIYLLSMVVLLEGAALLNQSQEVEGLKKQTANYEQLLLTKDKDIIGFKLSLAEKENLICSYISKVDELAQIIEDKNTKIFDLRKQVKTQQEEQRKEAEAKANQSVVFNPNDVTVPSNVTVEQLEKALEGTKLQPLASTYVKIEEEKGINALFLVSLTAWESGWGRSDFAVNLNNVGGVKNPNANGYRYFVSRNACLEYIASFLSMSYLNPNGEHYNGKSVSGVSVKYNFGEEEWVNGITSVAKGLITKAQK